MKRVTLLCIATCMVAMLLTACEQNSLPPTPPSAATLSPGITPSSTAFFTPSVTAFTSTSPPTATVGLPEVTPYIVRATVQGGGTETPSQSLPQASAIVLSSHTGAVTDIAWSPDGKPLASCSGALTDSGASDYDVRLWRADGMPLGKLTGHTGPINSVARSHDALTLASGSSDGTIRLWRPDGALVRTLMSSAGRVEKVAWSPDGKILASASDDKTVRLWTIR